MMRDLVDYLDREYDRVYRELEEVKSTPGIGLVDVSEYLKVSSQGQELAGRLVALRGVRDQIETISRQHVAEQERLWGD
ncbi:MAG: hypothetical protein PHW63_08995, partial [Alphaproteobacteria bacterium]|nr:hypothetical protein [Alphaproteobacteria bacterium]